MRVRILLLFFFACTSALTFLHTQEQGQTNVINITPRAVMILAAADVQPASPEKASELADALKTFNQVLWDDLSFSGFFRMASKSYYPQQPIVKPEDVNYEAWSAFPFKLEFMTAGTMDLSEGVLSAKLRVFDMKQHSISFDQWITGDARTIAHLWADIIVSKLTAGASKGIASTKIAFTSRRGSSKERNAKEIYIMDYDGHNQQAFTHNNSLNLCPNWAPDNSKIAFVSYRTEHPEVNIYSYLDGSRLKFTEFNTLAIDPAISPDGAHIVFALRTSRGDPDLFISKLDGSDRKNITNNPAMDGSPTWAPSGKQIAFSSNRENEPSQIYICDIDGANVRRIVKEGGDAGNPAWSPDGKWLAFHWKPYMTTNYDIFLAETGSGRIVQVTSNHGSNEYPTWAPDGRHLAFQSNRSGKSQIYIMFLDSMESRMITSEGTNTSPAWSGYFRKQ